MTTKTMELMKVFEERKNALNVARDSFRDVLNEMVNEGLAKKVEDGYGGGIILTIVANKSLLDEISYFIWEDYEPEFWHDEIDDGYHEYDGYIVHYLPGELEWF